jgi:hypothetical protein
MSPSLKNRFTLTIAALILILASAISSHAQIPLSFSKSFNPTTIGPGSSSTLQFDITNSDTLPISNLAFTDNLPAGVTIASPSNAASTCGGTLSALDGGGTISLSGGQVGASSTCNIVVDVTSSTLGIAMNVSGDLTSDAGNSGPATADLTVATDRPGFSKSFSPSSVPLGGRSTLTFTIDNSANASTASFLTFADTFPVGMVVAGPANESTTCIGGVVTAAPGTGTVSLANGSVAAGASCSVSVDVIGGAVGLLGNTSGELTSVDVFTTRSSGKASDTLEVTVDPISLIKSFVDDPVPPGSSVTLEFTITNFDRFDSATGIAFSDDLDAALSGLTFAGLLSNNCGGTVSGVGTTTVSFSGGTLAPAGSCTISASLQIPATAATGAYVNTTSTVAANVGGSPVVGSSAAETLFVSPAPVLTKSFTDDPVGAGESATLEFTLTNVSLTETATGIGFEDVFDVILPTASATPAAGFCGPGSTATFTPLINPPPPSNTIPARLTVAGASLAAGASCTFSIALDVAVGAPSGIYANVTTPVTANLGAESVVGTPAADDLVVVAGPNLLKEFVDDPVDPGDSVTLEFTLEHAFEATADATGIGFSDDLASVLTGLTAALPVSPDPPCGPGSSLTASGGDTFMTFAGGSLSPGSSCTFSVTLNVPVDAAPGSYSNTTSNVTATVSGESTTGNGASDDLMISTLGLTKEFTDDPVPAGGTVNLRFTLDNPSTIDATGIAFSDNLGNILPGTPDVTVVSALPIAACGGSLSGGPTLLSFSGGIVPAGTQCSFDVTVLVPAGTPDNTYINATSSLTSSLGIADPATDGLIVNSSVLAFEKQFTDDPVAPGGTATLEFTILNTDAVNGVDDISFTDDLGAALGGLTAIGLPINDICGAGSQLSGGGLLSLTGGSLSASGSCVFSATVQIPAAAAAGSYTNQTSVISGSLGGLPVTGNAATDDLAVSTFTFNKLFGGPVPAGGTTTLEFTIENLDPGAGVADIAFTDDLDAVVLGMEAVGLPSADVCGSGSLLSGTSILSLTGGNLAPGGSCTFAVDVQIPADATPGTYANTTSSLSQGGIPVGEPATADVVVEEALLGLEVPVTTPIGTLVLIALLGAAAVGFLRWRS